jgi:long-chain acyl-CoA synthetase
MAIPSMYAAILRLKTRPAPVAEQIYLAISGGEPLSDQVFEGFRDRFGIELLQGYGLTETSPVCTLELPDERKRGSIGRPIRNVSVRIVDSLGNDAGTDQDGEIWIGGPNVMKGYYQNPEATRQAITADGWFKTGDAGRMDAGGFVTITGRIKEMLIVGGENVYPREIESVLETHPAIAEAAVIGAPDPSRGEIPVAFVTLVEGASATPTELRAHAREHLAGYKVPREVRIADDLPRSPIGKILKRRLTELL